MKLEKALGVGRFLKRQYASGAHCSEPMCITCACIRLHDEVSSQMIQNETLKRHLELAAVQRRVPAPPRACVTCQAPVVDGICPNCNG